MYIILPQLLTSWCDADLNSPPLFSLVLLLLFFLCQGYFGLLPSDDSAMLLSSGLSNTRFLCSKSWLWVAGWNERLGSVVMLFCLTFEGRKVLALVTFGFKGIKDGTFGDSFIEEKEWKGLVVTVWWGGHSAARVVVCFGRLGLKWKELLGTLVLGKTSSSNIGSRSKLDTFSFLSEGSSIRLCKMSKK